MILSMNAGTGVGALYSVAGVLTPGAMGWYLAADTWNGWAAFELYGGGFSLWYDAANRWWISSAPGDTAAGSWESPRNVISGTYTPHAPYTGDAVVSKAPKNPLAKKGRAVTEWTKVYWVLRDNPKRWKRLPVGRQPNHRALGMAAAKWKALSAANKLIWGAAVDAVLQVRSGINVVATGFKRWIQVQMPMLYAGSDEEPTTTQRDEIQIQALEVVDVDLPTQEVVLYWEVKMLGAASGRFALHASQVPQDYLGTPSLFRYAKRIGTLDRELTLPDNNWHPHGATFPLLYPATAGQFLQFYIRFTLFRNDAPPVSAQLSRETTEQWALLTYVVD